MICDNYFCLQNRHGMCLSMFKNPDCSGREIFIRKDLEEKNIKTEK